MGFFPYLFFSGNCREAMTRYHEIFGGELFVMRMGDAPDTGDLPPEKADLVIHAAVMIDGGTSMTCFAITACGFDATNGGSPASISYRTHANA